MKFKTKEEAQERAAVMNRAWRTGPYRAARVSWGWTVIWESTHTWPRILELG